MSLMKRFQELDTVIISNCGDNQVCIPNGNMTANSVNQCVQICNDFAIAFYEWRSTSPIKNIDQYTNKELLEIYKQGL